LNKLKIDLKILHLITLRNNLEIEKKKRTAVSIRASNQIKALKIAKRKGINTFSALIDILVAEYIEKHLEVLQKN
jgi:hypothetical protein